MRIILMILVFFVTSFVAFSQTQCETNYALYRYEYKQKNFDEALDPWRKVFLECPEYNQYIFSNGPKIIITQINKNNEYREEYLDTLMMVYDKRIEYFGRREYVLGKKGVDLLRYAPERYLEAFHILKESVEGEGNLSSPTIIVSYFKSLVKSEITTEQVRKKDVLDAYILLSDIIDFNINNNDAQKDRYKKSLIDIENMFAPYASCEDLVNVFQGRFNDNSDDIELLKKITLLLSDKNCESSDLFMNVAIKLHEFEPTSSSAYYMASMNLQKKNYSKAVEYFSQAIKLEEDSRKRSAYYLQMAYALKMKGSYSSARNAAEKASKLRSGWGDPYLLIGDIYVAAANTCGNNAFEQSAVYLLAVDAFNTAKKIDNILSEKANKRIYTYSQYFPSKEDCFFNEIEIGSSYDIECWIGRSTIVRTRD